jgi:hypothetical protein
LRTWTKEAANMTLVYMAIDCVGGKDYFFSGS